MVRKAIAATLVLTAIVKLSGCGGTDNEASRIPVPGEWPAISLTRVAGGFAEPLGITHAGDGSGRLFIVERGGRVRLVKNGVVSDTPFLDISDRLFSAGGEQGLLGLAFPPDYATGGRFYVNYTAIPDGRTIVARYTVSVDQDRADAQSESVLITIPQPFSNHNGGQLAFGPDGYLYIGLGDGGSGGDPGNRAQDKTSLLGKILRIDSAPGDGQYGIPSDNPYVNNPTAASEIWALGLRNPWRFSFDRLTGNLYIADVGQSSREEVNIQNAESTGGENYGWNIMEGSTCFNDLSCIMAGLTPPVVEYDHTQGNCSVTGGYVYRGADFPSMQGIYFYGDFCTGRIWGLKKEGEAAANQLLLDSSHLLSTFGEDEAGNIYLADYGSGGIYLIEATKE